MLDIVRKKVKDLLDKDNSGHGMDHVDRVVDLTIGFAKKERADKDISVLIALLHDVDDYKLVGKENEDKLLNANRILDEVKCDDKVRKIVLDGIKCIGYSKRLKGIKPDTLEAMIVSDADMCDALGAHAIMRTIMYNVKESRLFFDKKVFPIKNDMNQYVMNGSETGICHLFDKVLRLKELMLTESGKIEAETRHDFVNCFLYQFFKEENSEEWIEYLNKFNDKNMINY